MPAQRAHTQHYQHQPIYSEARETYDKIISGILVNITILILWNSAKATLNLIVLFIAIFDALAMRSLSYFSFANAKYSNTDS